MISTNYLTPPKDRAAKWLERGFCVAVLLSCVLAMSHHQADPDLWGHVQYGRDVIQDGLPRTTTYSYTTQNHPWINHENLSELLMATAVDRVGPAALLVFKSLMALTLLVLVYYQGRRDNVSLIPLYIALLLVASNQMYCWTVRPQLLSYVFFTLLIALLCWCFSAWPNPWPALLRGGADEPRRAPGNESNGKQLRWLWLLVPLFIVWTNGHGGFVAGYCILTAYLGMRCLEALMAHGRAAWPTVRLLTAVLFVTGLATLVNPYGLELHQWLIGSLTAARPEIVEWHPPKLFSVVWPAWWLMVATFVAAMVFTRRRRDVTHLVILCLTLWQACEHRRHIAFFAILFGFWLPVHLESLWGRLRGKQPTEADTAAMSPRMRYSLLAIVSVLAVTLSISIFLRFRHIVVRRDRYPVSAFQYITDQELDGNLIVRFRWAQYAIAAFAADSDHRPHLQVAFDGRFRTCYPQELVDMYFDFAVGDAPPELRYRDPKSPPVNGGRILNHKNPDLVLIGRTQTYSARIMEERTRDWTLLYQDEMAQLWGRGDKYDNPRSPDHVPVEDRVIGNEPQTGYVAWPALPPPKGQRIQLVHTDVF
ncbi:MAG: hypothetical protein ACQESR_10725 [Planctomycetota bacterium]